jgi:hypothetical protein
MPLFDPPNIPVTTAHQARLQLAQPTRRPQMKIREVQTAYGIATVEGKIGQCHLDFLEAISRHYIDRKDIKDDQGRTAQVVLLFDPHVIRKALGGNLSRYPMTRLTTLSDDLRLTSIKFSWEDKKGKYSVTGGIVDLVEKAEALVSSRNGQSRHLWKIYFNKAFVNLIRFDINLCYDPIPIIRLKQGVSQAVVRWLNTHCCQPNGGWRVDAVLKAVCGDMENDDLRNRRRELKMDEKGVKATGYLIENGRIFKTTV